MTLWWGYLHTNGTIQVKRSFGHPLLAQQDIDEALKSPFCKKVFAPFEALTREHAIKQVENYIAQNNDKLSYVTSNHLLLD